MAKQTMNKENPAISEGVRKLSLQDIAPDCEIHINREIYDLKDIAQGKSVVDIGCGYGRNKPIVESVGGSWIGVEPFEGGAHTVVADAEDLPFDNDTFDVVIMDAVLEHIPDASKAFAEVARVLKPNGVFIGYVAFMECFHEISYSHISFKGLEHFSSVNGMKLEKISGGGSFGIDYHLNVLLYPLPFRFFRKIVAAGMRFIFRTKSILAFLALRILRRLPAQRARHQANLYYQIECLRQSNGFHYLIRKK